MTSTPAPYQHSDDRQPSRRNHEEIAILLKLGKDLLDNGDLAAARLLLRRAAEAGSAEGALMLGTTFDPVELRRLGAIGARPDLAKARQWYQRAAELAQVPLRSNWRASRTLIEVAMFVDAKVRMYGVFARRCPCSIA